jgi:hypothetical protein
MSDMEKALDRACKWLHQINEEEKLGHPFASPDTWKHFFLDEDFHERMNAQFQTPEQAK